MFKTQLLFDEFDSGLEAFIYQALGQGIRLDGRGLNDYRDISIELSRDECRSESSVKIGATRVLCVVNAEIVVPYPDRSTEGILQFTVDISLSTEQAGYSSSQLCRMLERSIRDSEALDTESLCIIAGEKVWSIVCDVKILNYDGNVLDACNLAAMSALRAFRKPEVSVLRQDLLDVQNTSSSSSATYTVVKLHNTDEREPLPLALHHTPLSITYGVVAVKSHLMPKAANQQSSILLLSDPTSEEESLLEGYITFSFNAHREVCAVLKPGGVSMSTEDIILTGSRAVERSTILHSHLSSALQALDSSYYQTRIERLEHLRKYRHLQEQYQQSSIAAGTGVGGGITADEDMQDGGIDIDDPILQYNFNHASVASLSLKS